MSSKSQYRPGPKPNQQPADPALQAQITQRMMDAMFGGTASGGDVKRPDKCGSCAYCNGTADGIKCFALPPKIVWINEDDGEGGRVFSSSQIRPTVELGDPGCSLGVCR